MSGRAVVPQPFSPPEITYPSAAGGEQKAAYEHGFAVRLTHWLNAVALFVLAGSGLRIYLAFPAFGDKLPPREFFTFPGRYSIGGWLGGALQLHFTFMWLFLGAGLLYTGYQILSGGWRQVLFLPRDARGIWPMFRHYFLFGPRPEQTESYNALQKLAYTAILLLAALSTITGLILYKSAQLAFLIPLFGGYRAVRLLHFLALVGFLAFVPGHIVMVIAHGWNNFQSILTGWNFKPAHATTAPAPAGDVAAFGPRLVEGSQTPPPAEPQPPATPDTAKTPADAPLPKDTAHDSASPTPDTAGDAPSRKEPEHES